MKKLLPAIFLTGLFFLVQNHSIAQPGKYAGTKKTIIGKSFTDIRVIPGMKGWTMMEGSLLNMITDPEYIFAEVYKKGTTWVIIFSIKEDTAIEKYVIKDVIEVTGVAKGWSIRVGTCTRATQPDPYIVTWGKEDQEAYMKIFKKAWRFDPDKRRVESIPVKGIECENIGC